MKLSRLVTAGESKFTNGVSVSVYLQPSGDIDYSTPKQVAVTFSVDEEWRSWGMKGALVVVNAIEPIVLTDVSRYGDNDEVIPMPDIVVNVDPSLIKKEHSFRRAVTVGDLELQCDLAGNVDYENSSIEVSDF